MPKFSSIPTLWPDCRGGGINLARIATAQLYYDSRQTTDITSDNEGECTSVRIPSIGARTWPLPKLALLLILLLNIASNSITCSSLGFRCWKGTPQGEWSRKFYAWDLWHIKIPLQLRNLNFSSELYTCALCRVVLQGNSQVCRKATAALYTSQNSVFGSWNIEYFACVSKLSHSVLIRLIARSKKHNYCLCLI